MSNEIVKKTENQNLVTVDRNVFEIYADKLSQTTIVGQLLKFSKGDWLVGRENEELPADIRLVANMDQLLVGWIKWVDNKPEQQIMGLIKDGYVEPPRKDMGDLDKAAWELDDRGEPRDPWQKSIYMVMKRAGEQFDATINAYTFTTTSDGGIKAVGKLMAVYGKAIRDDHADDYPVVELDQESYLHSNKQFGRIKKPVFNVIDWEAKKFFEAKKTVINKSTAGKPVARPTGKKKVA